MKPSDWIGDLKAGLMEGDEYKFLVRDGHYESRKIFRLEKKRDDYCEFSYKPEHGTYRIHTGIKYDDVRQLLTGATLQV